MPQIKEELNINKKNVDWLLLVFLVLFTNQAVLSLKIAGLVFIYLFRSNFRFGFDKGRLPKFYIYILLLAVFAFFFITREFTYEYIVAFTVGNLFWIFSLMGAHQVKISIEKYGASTAYNTMKVFSFINFFACIYQLASIMIETGTINPYNEMLPFPYGMSTGDNIYGAFLQNSYYNNMVSAILAVYFIFRRNVLHTLLATTCLVMIFGNFGTIVFAGILTALFFTGIFADVTRSINNGFFRWVRQISPPGNYLLYLPLMVGFIALLYYMASPKNLSYIVDKAKDKIFSVKSNDDNNYATIIGSEKMEAAAFDPFSNYLDRKEDSLVGNSNVASFSRSSDFIDSKLDAKLQLTQEYINKLQGKNLSVLETWAFLKSSPKAFLFGAGTTRFSSLTAQKMSGYDSSRIFMTILPHYVSKLYSENHMLLIKVRSEAKDKALYSTANWPDSFYNKMLGEYGVIGMLLFIVFYLGFFAKKMHKWSYGLWIIAILLPFAHLNYVFDTLCVIPFFELLMFADIDEPTVKQKPEEQYG
jgi:hypothetical protein